MLNLPFLPKNLGKVDLEGYPRRLEHGVEALARACGLDAAAELARFRHCRDRLGVQPKAGPANDVMDQVRQSVLGNTPLIFELVTTFVGDELKGFAYLTQGRPTGSLPASLGTLLAGALELYLGGGGTKDEATLLVDVFGLTFPNLNALAEFSALSQAMIVGLVPHGEALAFKVYFNTRLDAVANHRERVGKILARCGLDDLGLYDLLYANNDGARFHGVGIDLDNDARRRAKLYVRLTLAQLEPSLKALAARLTSDTAAAAATIVEPALGMLEAMRGDALVDEVELAVGLRKDGAPTAKVTLFWASGLVGDREYGQLKTYLVRLGYPERLLDEPVAALAENAERAVSQKHPFHGLGIEVPVGQRPKINVYLQPVL